jgi:hypothetical protein
VDVWNTAWQEIRVRSGRDDKVGVVAQWIVGGRDDKGRGGDFMKSGCS